MIFMRKILVLFIIFMMLVPFVCAGDTKHVGDEKVVSEKPTTEKVTDKTKEKTTEITSKDKSITGKITVTDTDISKYKVEKKSSTEISISKEEAKGEHTKAKVSISKSELQKIDIDGDGKFGLLHISDNGEVTHTTATEAELVAGKVMTFSTNIVNGYSGYKQYTFSNVESGDTLNIDDVSAPYVMTAAVSGVVPTYTAINPHNKSTYPSSSSLLGSWNFNNVSGGYVSSEYGGPTAQIINGSVVNGHLSANGYTYILNPYSNAVNHTFMINLKCNATSGDPYVANMWGSNIKFRYILSTNKFRVFNSTTYVESSALDIEDGKYHFVIYKRTGDTVSLSVDNTTLLSKTLKYNPGTTTKYYMLAASDLSSKWQGDVDDITVYSSAISITESHIVYAGGSGISFQPEPSYNFTGYNVASGAEKVLNTDSTCTGIEYVDTTGGTHNVTVTVYFTEDTTLISEEHNLQYQNVSIVHIAGHNATNGTIAYELLSAYTGTPVLTGTNNSNASVSRNTTHLLISTDTLKTGQSFYYNVSVPTGNGAFANPSATVVVIIGAAGAFIGGSFINAWYRRRKNN